MPTYIITKTSDQVEIESVITIKADSLESAQEQAEKMVEEYNNLGNDHATNWVVKSVIEKIGPPAEVELPLDS